MPTKKRGPYKSPSQRAKSKHPWKESDRIAREYFGGHSSSTQRKVQQNTIDEYRKDTELLRKARKARNRDLLKGSNPPKSKKEK